MSAEIIPFDFEEQAVRVVMRGEDPWFVAADVCRVLEIQNATDVVKRLDEDEVTLDTIEGNHRPTNLINESGLYALVLTSRKEQAKRFRKWITAEVLPAIRRHGRYELPGARSSDVAGDGDFLGMTFREAELWLQSVREARLTRGRRAAIRLWDRSPLPVLTDGPTSPAVDPAQGRACLAHLLDQVGDMIGKAREGSELAGRVLADDGMRVLPDGLFVANFALALFEGTDWGARAHKAALLALPGVTPDTTARSLSGVVTRGLVLPWSLLDGEGA
ncbi:BRO-N domain-containing protein [Roseovarius indicus]|uniref:Putative phage-encoded protein n=1 Tax=Roseovarius indicus TaxID=540747 RepID=A0A5P3AHV5_9RHOB|nr:BRO family protein [Roseovarius indicus]QEW27835.1 putative phage-encoded protein [Roseovarius indicus]SFE79555.1 BRO family, N-terminal domain [Roseovarius indicus]